MAERWKPIPGYEGKYGVSNRGRVKSLARMRDCNGGLAFMPERIRKQDYAKGYFQLSLLKNAKKRIWKIARLVALAFLPNPENKPQVNHKDGNKRNNRLSNLEWATRSENMKHAYQNGLERALAGEENGASVLTNEKATRIREWYADGFSQSKIAEKFGVDQVTVSRVVHHKSYA